MVEKKYKLKSEIEIFADGTNNQEHIKDIVKQIDLLYCNIQDNNDICMQVFALRKKDQLEEDILDALQIACQNSIEIENQAVKIMEVIKKFEDKFDKNCQTDLEKFLKQMENYEKKSKKIMESVLSI